MVRWLERNGYDVAYVTDIDVHENPNLLLTHHAFLSVAHDEYWSWQMRQNVQTARDAGVGLGFFGGNESFWQIRLEPSTINGAADRTQVAYKSLNDLLYRGTANESDRRKPVLPSPKTPSGRVVGLN